VSAVASSQPDDLPTLAGIDWISSPGPACCPPETEGIAYDLGAPATMNRWPEFTGQATRLGLEHMRAIPLPHRHRLTGALLLFHSGVRELTPANLRLAQSLALTTASALLKECDTQSLERRNAQLQNALTSRIVIEQAKGIIAARLDTGLDQAFDLLRQYARARRKLLADLAREVVEGIADHAVLDQDP
jgi:hypothetical protein